MSDQPETPQPILKVVSHSKNQFVLWIIAGAFILTAIFGFLSWRNPSDKQAEIDSIKKDAINKVDSLTNEIKITRRANDSLEYIAAYVDTSKKYIAQLEHKIAQKEVNRQQENAIFEEKKKAVANETDMESIEEIKKSLNRRK